MVLSGTRFFKVTTHLCFYLGILIDPNFILLESTGTSPFVEGRVATFGEENDRHASRMTKYTTHGQLFEGDIVLTKEQSLLLTNERVRRDTTNQRVRRKISTDLSQRWKLPINYTFDGSHDYTERKQIRAAVFHWSTQTCIRFREVSYSPVLNETIVFTKGSGCWSSVGYVGNHGNQEISIAEDCLWMGTVAHEIGHAIGFWHEQARPDRDDYVTILTKNVMSDRLFNFQRSNWGQVMSYGVPYDVGSLMHYGSRFFSRNTQRTIETRDPRLQRVLGQRDGLSFADSKQANAAYCSHLCQNQSASPLCSNDGYPDPLDCSICRCPDGLGGETCDTVAPSSAECGGVLSASHQVAYIQSPGYPRAYGSHVRCHWLIQAPPGYRIYFEFVDQFSVTEDVPNDACVNSVEVRYYESLSQTGGRFCGSARPQDTMISQSSQLLLLFRSQEAGSVGFKAKYHTEVCGGCLSSPERQQKACARTVTYPCVRQWRSRVRRPCIRWWGWIITDCGYTYKTRTREDRCTRTEWYCCKGFRLEGDICRSLSQEEDTKKIPGYNGDGSGSTVNETRVIPVGWSAWSHWSDCTKACGGCGRQTRRRQCSSPVFCGGLESQEQTDPCNQEVCPEAVKEFCLKKYPVTRICNPWTLEKCTEYKTKMETCHKPCCQGYVRVDERCILSRK